MKSSYVVRAANFLCRIYPRIADYMNMPAFVRNRILTYNAAYNRNVEVHSGATRCALITSDYVIKWDCNERNVKNFGGCADEIAMYELARQEGYEYLLAEATPFWYRGILFEIMPRFNMGIDDEKPELYDCVNGDEFDWLCEHIGDLHEGNYTFVDDHIIITDYACPVREYVPSSNE